MSNQVVASGLSERIARLSARLSYKRAIDPAYRAQVFKLRHEAYLREGAISPQPGSLFTDPIDDAPNTWLFGVHIDGTLMSSIRITVSSPKCPRVPTGTVFPDVVQPHIEAGRIVVDPTRFVVNAISSRSHPELPYVTLRIAWMAMEYFEGDLLLAAVRPEHVAFYKRFWCSQIVAPARLYPHLTKPVALTISDFHEVRDQVHARYPFLRSSQAERERAYGQSALGRSSALAAASEMGSGVSG
jgi:hypothetical protein